MEKKIVVFGSREYDDYFTAKKYIEYCISEIKQKYTLIFISGGCRGADKIGERYAKENGFSLRVLTADWQKHGKAAGPIRNEQMSQEGDFFICFWNGKSRGTKNMLENIRIKEKPVRIMIIETV